jgi:YARHG domain
MKRIFVTAAALLMMVGCKETVTEGPALAENMDAVTHGSISADDLGSVVNDEHTELYGTWTGFALNEDEVLGVDASGLADPSISVDGDKMSIAIKNFSEGSAEALALVSGTKYTLRGTYKAEGNKFLISLYRGAEQNKRTSFELVLENDRLIGTYKASKTETPKRVELKHSVFTYDPAVMLEGSGELIDWDNPKVPDAPQASKSKKTEAPEVKTSEAKPKKKTLRYLRPQYRFTSEGIENINASTTKLTEAELKNFTKFDLEILRNTIYARHGYAFKKEFLRQLYNYTEWYVAISDNVDADLTGIEKQNIALLTRMEKYAQDHYQYFGR